MLSFLSIHGLDDAHAVTRPDALPERRTGLPQQVARRRILQQPVRDRRYMLQYQIQLARRVRRLVRVTCQMRPHMVPRRTRHARIGQQLPGQRLDLQVIALLVPVVEPRLHADF